MHVHARRPLRLPDDSGINGLGNPFGLTSWLHVVQAVHVAPVGDPVSSTVPLPIRDLGRLVDATTAIRVPDRPAALRIGYGIRLVRTGEQLSTICQLRTAAYTKRLPDMAAMMGSPEPEDTEPGTFIFVATRLSDDKPVGTARLQTNMVSPLEFETHIELPASFQGRLLAQGTRLAVVADNDTILVTKLLLKAMHAFCRGFQVSYILVAAEPPRDRFYRAFGFREIFPGLQFLIESAPNHRCALLSFDFDQTEELLGTNPGHLAFLKAYCPDIQIFSSLFASWVTPRLG